MTRWRQGLLVLLGLWAGLGIVLAPSRPMPGMAEMHTVHTQEDAEGHHSPRAPEENKGNKQHTLKCVLCLVGAGALPVVIGPLPVSSPVLQVKGLALPHPGPRRFRHFRSRAPPLAG